MRRGLCHLADLECYKATGLWKWPNFQPKELVCKCGCDEGWFDSQAFDALQWLRDNFGRPLKVNSAHRCVDYNRRIGGASRSEHLKIAFDISLDGITKRELKQLDGWLKHVGFLSKGLYDRFIHVDMRQDKRYWVVDGGEWLQQFLPHP